MAHRVVGIDVGHDLIRGAEVEDPGTARERVLRRGTVELAPGAVVSGEVRDVAAVAAALKQLWQQAGFKTRRVVLGLGNARVLARDLDVPVRPAAQIREQLPFLVADLLPMPLEQAVLDFYPVREYTDEQGIDMYAGILIVALNEVAVTNARAAQQAGLEVVGIDMIPFALVRRLAETGSGETVAFVDVGATTTSITVAESGTPVFCRIVPVGGEEVTRSLVELGQLSREQAEQVKRTIGLSAEGVEPRYRPVVELMVTRTSDLMTSIRDTIAYYDDTRAARISRILLTGGGARLGGFAPMVAAWTRIPTELVDLGEHGDYLVAEALASGARGAATRGGVARRTAGPTAPPTPTAPVPVPDLPVPAGGPPPAPSAASGAVPATAAADMGSAAPVATEPEVVPAAPPPVADAALGMPGGMMPTPLDPPEAGPRHGRGEHGR